MAKYRLKDGARVKADAQIVGEFIEAIQKRNGGIAAPEAIVDAARPKDSPIHDEFEWNDKRAGEQFRLEQARLLLRSIEVIEHPDSDQTFSTRAFVYIGDRHQYRSIADVRKSDDMMGRLLSIAMSELSSFKRKYACLKKLDELRPVFAAIESAEAKAAKRKMKQVNRQTAACGRT